MESLTIQRCADYRVEEVEIPSPRTGGPLMADESTSRNPLRRGAIPSLPPTAAFPWSRADEGLEEVAEAESSGQVDPRGDDDFLDSGTITLDVPADGDEDSGRPDTD
jgi:hypothetical protein